ncbi:MAG TPA: response regulator [Calditrichaeota bacterium]|nr:response regulator [Calditrichota bacterium]
MKYVILAIVLFVLLDVIIRLIVKKINDVHLRKERERALQTKIEVDFGQEVKTLKRVEVKNPKAKILAVDDEPIILDSFRKILVLDGYSVDTVESGKEAISLLKNHHYDFVFTDLKMPEMDGVEVTKTVKNIRPDIDVIIITGYATVETAVETMKYGAMDYVQKPFSEDELLDLVNKSLIKRTEKIKDKLRPRVQIIRLSEKENSISNEFLIPGGVFISEGHTWMSIDQGGTVLVGLDDFARKVIGQIDSIDFPNLGMHVQRGKTLFSIIQDNRAIPFKSPISGTVSKINNALAQDKDKFSVTPYEKNWICKIETDDIDTDIGKLKIGKSAVLFYQDEIKRCKKYIKNDTHKEDKDLINYYYQLDKSLLQKLELDNWQKFVDEFFIR